MNQEDVLNRRTWYMMKLSNSPFAPAEQREYWLSSVEICNLALKGIEYDETGRALYCTDCGSCGEPGCCPPSKCKKFVVDESKNGGVR